MPNAVGEVQPRQILQGCDGSLFDLIADEFNPQAKQPAAGYLLDKAGVREGEDVVLLSSNVRSFAEGIPLGKSAGNKESSVRCPGGETALFTRGLLFPAKRACS